MKLRHIFESPIPQSLKTKVFNQLILLVMTYGAETWTLSIGLVHKFKVAQGAMKRMIFDFIGRPAARWTGDLNKVAGSGWMWTA